MLSILLSWYSLGLLASLLLYWHGTRNFSHWRDRGVKHIPPVFFFGNLRKRILFQLSFHEFQKEMYFAFPGQHVAGLYEGRKPSLMIRDPELIRLVLVRDFDHFVDRPILRFRHNPSISNMLISLQGAQWKSVRATLTPTFTSGKMKAMSFLVDEVGRQMCEFLSTLSKDSEGCDLEMKDFYGRFTLDVIATCAFGVQCDSLQSPNAEFATYAGKFNDVSLPERLVIFAVLLLFPSLTRILPLSFMNRDVVRFLENVVRETKEKRIQSGVRRNDFLQLMIDAAEAERNQTDKPPVLSEEVIIAQSILFLLAGFETSSTVLTFASYELALNPEIQEKLRSEIMQVLQKHEGQFSYDALLEMEYLDMVLYETMRKHPPVARMDRACTKEYEVPGTSVKLQPGESVLIPVMGLHYDPQYYPNPTLFDPNRFSSEEKNQRSPFVYLPFGAGPRHCIGTRFAMMSTKMALAHLLCDFQLQPCTKTEVPYIYSKYSMLLKAKNGIWINVKPLSGNPKQSCTK